MSFTPLAFHLRYFGACINKVKNTKNVIPKYIKKIITKYCLIQKSKLVQRFQLIP